MKAAMKILYTGANGQLGREIEKAALNRDVPAVGFSHQELDITRPDEIKRAIAAIKPTLIVNCAAYTAVDKAESEPEQAFAINRDGPAHLADICSADDVALIHISTDYVFDGNKKSAYVESDPICPINVYGESKAAGESEIIRRTGNHIIIRTSWVYGCNGNNFVKTMLRLGRERDRIGVVDDQFGSPTYAADLAEAVLVVANAVSQGNFSHWGVYHFANQGVVSWYKFAQAIFEITEKSMELKLNRLAPLTTAQYPTAAKRPIYSVLNTQKISRQFAIDPPFYRSSLERMLNQLLTGSY